MKILKQVLIIMLAVMMVITAMPVSAATGEVYYNIDFSAAVAKSRILQQVDGDCGVVSMATIEAYMYGATSKAERKKVYDAVVAKNTDTDYAYWGNIGYVKTSINWQTVYDNLEKGYPTIIHYTKGAGHYAVVAGYKGSTTNLESDKFIVVNVYDPGTNDYYPTSTTYKVMPVSEWRQGSSIDTMVYRKNGMAITSLSGGIKMAVNVPQYVHPQGNGHGVYGYVASSSTLNTVQIRIVNAKNGTLHYNKTVDPNAKYYQVYKQDSNIKFAELAAGEYYYTVYAKDDAGNTKFIKKYFIVGNSWPKTIPTDPKITVKFDANGGMGSYEDVILEYMEGSFTIPTTLPIKTGCVFDGYYVNRMPDNTWYVSEIGKWLTLEECEAGGYTPRLYERGMNFQISPEWIKGGTSSSPTFTFYAQWTNVCAGGNHDYIVTVTPPTCVDKGYSRYVCSRCQDTYETDYVSATGKHTYSDSSDTSCNVCGYVRVVATKTTPMYRMYNPNSGEHFYTGSTEERDILVNAGWHYEGVAFNFPVVGAPVHRLYEPITGEHLYTMDEVEKAKLIEEGWRYEGVAFNSAGEDEVAQYRLHNPNATCGAYHFTGSTEERDILINAGWEYQGIGWYSCVR